MQRGGYREEEDNRTKDYNGVDISQETGPRPGTQRQRLGRAPQEGWLGGERRRERGVERWECRVFVRIGDGGGQDDRRGTGGEKRNADGVSMGHAKRRCGSGTGGYEVRRERHQ